MAGIERLTPNDVDFEIEKRACDTVLVGYGDAQGRLAGARVGAQHFLSDALPNGIRVPAYLLTTDASGRVGSGTALDSAATGYRDLVLKVDPASYFRMGWQEGTVGVLGDLEFGDGTTVTMSPRAVLKRQTERLEAQGLTGTLGAEPQFTIVSEDATGGGHLAFRSARLEPVVRRIRKAVAELPLPYEATHGMQYPGLIELALRPGNTLQVCDGVLVVRDIVKEFAAQAGLAATFMAAPDDDVVSACHLSISLRGLRATSALADHYGEAGLSEVGKAFVAGLLEHAPEVCILYAPNLNSYRRFGRDGFTPSTLTWGLENRTCAVRVTGADTSLRVENRIPGSDANTYLATAAMIASGLDGISRQLRLPAPLEGDSRTSDAAALPGSLAEAAALWSGSEWVRTTFGPEVQRHYADLAAAELDAAPATPDLAWEQARYFEAY